MHCIYACVGIIVVIATLLVLVTLLLVFLLIHEPYSENFLQVEGVTTVTKSIPSFWYKRIDVAQILRLYDYNYRLSVCKNRCDELLQHSQEYRFESPKLEAAGLIRNVGELSYLYLLKESSLEYRMCLENLLNKTNTVIDFFIFSNEVDFSSYQAGLEDGRKAIQSNHYRIGNKSVCFEIDFVALSSDFYFFVGQANNPVLYQFNVSGSIFYFNISDYSDSCTMTNSQKCSFSLQSGFRNLECILTYSHPFPPYLTNPQTTHTRISVYKSMEILYLIIPLAIIIILMFVLICVCYYTRCVFCHHKIRYESLN